MVRGVQVRNMVHTQTHTQNLNKQTQTHTHSNKHTYIPDHRHPDEEKTNKVGLYLPLQLAQLLRECIQSILVRYLKLKTLLVALQIEREKIWRERDGAEHAQQMHQLGKTKHLESWSVCGHRHADLPRTHARRPVSSLLVRPQFVHTYSRSLPSPSQSSFESSMECRRRRRRRREEQCNEEERAEENRKRSKEEEEKSR
jgi:hypothetical protein